jgi:hypothetical protein
MSYRIECFFEIDEKKFSEKVLQKVVEALDAHYRGAGLAVALLDEKDELMVERLYNDGKGSQIVAVIDEKSRGGFDRLQRGVANILVGGVPLGLSAITKESDEIRQGSLKIAEGKVLIKAFAPDYIASQQERKKIFEAFVKSLLVVHDALLPNWGRADHELVFDAIRNSNFGEYLLSGNFLPPADAEKVSGTIKKVESKVWKTLRLSNGGMLIIFGTNIVQQNHAISEEDKQKVASELGLKVMDKKYCEEATVKELNLVYGEGGKQVIEAYAALTVQKNGEDHSLMCFLGGGADAERVEALGLKDGDIVQTAFRLLEFKVGTEARSSKQVRRVRDTRYEIQGEIIEIKKKSTQGLPNHYGVVLDCGFYVETNITTEKELKVGDHLSLEGRLDAKIIERGI